MTTRIMRALKLDQQPTTADKIRILIWYALVAGATAFVFLLLFWALWPYNQVQFDGETRWVEGVDTQVRVGEIADLSFWVPEVCNSEGQELVFTRVIASGPRDDAGTTFRWPIDDAELNPGRPFCDGEIPVRVIFPVLYQPGEYTIQMQAIYKPNPLFPRAVSFQSPVFEIVE